MRLLSILLFWFGLCLSPSLQALQTGAEQLERYLPLLQGTILVLAMFFVLLNLVVDVIQTLLDPRIAR